MKKLSPIQRKVLAFYRDYRRTHGIVPTQAIAARGLGLASSVSISYHLRNFDQIKYLKLQKKTPRSVVLFDDTLSVVKLGPIEENENVLDHDRTIAYAPTAISELVSDLPSYFVIASDDSMNKLGIQAGDWVAVADPETAKSGDVVVVRTGGELLLRRYRRINRRRIELAPESTNNEHKAIDATAQSGPAWQTEGVMVGAIIGRPENQPAKR